VDVAALQHGEISKEKQFSDRYHSAGVLLKLASVESSFATGPRPNGANWTTEPECQRSNANNVFRASGSGGHNPLHPSDIQGDSYRPKQMRGLK
jgi:hypothetical protein